MSLTRSRPELTALRPRASGLSHSLNSQKEETMFSFKIQKLTRKLLILGILLGCLLFLVLTPSMRAQDSCTMDCESTDSTAIQNCTIDYIVCIVSGFYT